MTDPRLEDALHLSQGPLVDGRDTCLCREDAARIAATDPGTSILADAAMGKAHAAVMEWAYRIDYHHGFVHIWTSPSDYERYDSTALALGDEMLLESRDD